MSPHKDKSLEYLQELLDQGFKYVKWISSDEPCEICQSLNGEEWDLEDFISNLEHEAPIFEHSHVNCRCHIEVSNDDSEIIKVNYDGLL